MLGLKKKSLQEIVKAELNVKHIAFSKKAVKGKGLRSEGEGEMIVTLDTNISKGLKQEGQWNEFLRKYRNIRKKLGLKIEDIVNIYVDSEDKEILGILEKKFGENKKDLQMNASTFGEAIDDVSGKFMIDEEEIKVRIEKV